MDDLVKWLGAQLDEDERIAQLALDQTGSDWRAYYKQIVATNPRYGEDPADANTSEVADFIARHDPARVLREIDTKRRTLIRCEEAMMSASPMLVHFAKQTAWEMTRPYADRPGYRDDWRP